MSAPDYSWQNVASQAIAAGAAIGSAALGKPVAVQQTGNKNVITPVSGPIITQSNVSTLLWVGAAILVVLIVAMAVSK